MSIIVDALERVQTDRNDKKVPYHITDSPDDREKPFSNNNEAGANHSKLYTRLIIASLILILLVNVFFMYQKPNKKSLTSNFEGSNQFSEVETINESLPTFNMEHTQTEETEKIDDEFLTAFKDEESQATEDDFEMKEVTSNLNTPTSMTIIAPTLQTSTTPIFTPTMPVGMTSKFTSIQTLASANTLTSLETPMILPSQKIIETPKEEIITPISKKIIQPNPEPKPKLKSELKSEPKPLPKSEPKPEPKIALNQLPIDKAIIKPKETIKTQAVKKPKKLKKTTSQKILPTPSWVVSGTKVFHKKGLNKAVPIWNKGFSSIRTKKPIIAIMTNRVAEHASDTLTKLHKNHIDAFTVQGLFKGKPAYFTLALYNETNPKKLMGDIEKTIKGKPFKSSKRLLQKRINQLVKYNAKTTKSVKKIAAKKKIIKKQAKIVKIKPIQAVKFTKVSPEKRLLAGQEAVINGEYNKAITKLRPALFYDDKNWEVLFWMGSAKLGLGLYNEADNYFKNALALNSEIPQLWTQRAIISQERDDHISALKFLQRAKTLSPNIPEVILNMAYSNDALGDKNGAVLAYREFLSLTRGNGLFAQQRQAVNSRLEELGF